MGLFDSIIDSATSGITNQAIKGVSDLVLGLGSDDSEESGAEATTATAEPAAAASKYSFDELLSGLLKPGGNGKVNEEMLFGAMASERVKALHGDEAAAKFDEIFAAEKRDFMHNGFSIEAAAKAALKELRDQEVITSEEADTIYTQAFDAAQLDNNKEALWDGIGAEVAELTMSDAIASAKARIASYGSAKEALPTIRSLDDKA